MLRTSNIEAIRSKTHFQRQTTLAGGIVRNLGSDFPPADKRIKTMIRSLSIVLLVAVGAFSIDPSPVRTGQARRQSKIFGGPQGMYVYSVRGHSNKGLLSNKSTDKQPSVLSRAKTESLGKRSPEKPWNVGHADQTDSIRIIAFRVEFAPDSIEGTTGNGEFARTGVSTPTAGDREESRYYEDKTYKYDNLPHDKTYFEHQLQFAADYFSTVSGGKFGFKYTVYPEDQYGAYKLDKKMVSYSPGEKFPEESWDEYYLRRTVALMRFIKDAVRKADSEDKSPFANVRADTSNGKITWYSKEHSDSTREYKTAFLVIHAGASYLTDGGEDGAFGIDSPSDMIDAFIAPDFFEYFVDSVDGISADTLNGNIRYGVRVDGNNDRLLIDELMMVSETSNQDGLNWGIHGILVNQIARQIGIPDLFSTMSGISGVGGFCIMDFAGYSAAKGFIPPWPSAWVRAFYGWDQVKVAEVGEKRTVPAVQTSDSTILLVPLNQSEYYLIENRQRNLAPDSAGSPFNYETDEDHDIKYIKPWDRVNLEKAVVKTSDDPQNVIMKVRNYDVGIPASGVLVWHIDDDLINNRLEFNMVNADSLYRGVNLVEADGITDLGVQFQDAFYNAAFDYGGAQDIFPHQTVKRPGEDYSINSFGPFTRPSTKSNSGGHTYLNIKIAKTGKVPLGRENAKETAAVRDYFVYNFVDSAFRVSISRDELMTTPAGWPKHVVPDEMLDPVTWDLTGDGTHELAILDTSGRLYLWLSENPSRHSFGDSLARYKVVMSGKEEPDTVGDIRFFSRIPSPASFPTLVGGSQLHIPSGDGSIHVLKGLADISLPSSAEWDTISLPAKPTSHICNYMDAEWAVGTADGRVVFGSGTDVVKTVSTNPDAKNKRKKIQALALLDASRGTLAGVREDGLVFVCDSNEVLGSHQLARGIPPYSVVTADFRHDDLDNDPRPGIAVVDGKQGVWVLEFKGTPALADHWSNEPNDWASIYHYREDEKNTSRTLLPDNPSSPGLADIDKDGTLEIVLGGTNGVYALNYAGALISGWPTLLDRMYWYQRGVVEYTPVIGTDLDKDVRVLFSIPSGENVTYYVAKIDKAVPEQGKVIYHWEDARGERVVDSISGLTTSLIDSLVVLGDSLILPYAAPGGMIDAVGSNARRPSFVEKLPYVGKERQSFWPLSAGGEPSCAPMLVHMDGNKKVDVIAATRTGSVHRFELSENILSDSLVWPMTGFDQGRSFTYGGPALTKPSLAGDIQKFHNYPNPARDIDTTTFKYTLARPASEVRLDIFTYTGYHVLSASDLPTDFSAMEYTISLKKFGPAVYRCRLEATFPNGDKDVKYWKMAVIK